MAPHKSGGRGQLCQTLPNVLEGGVPRDNETAGPLLPTSALTKLAQPCWPGGLQPEGTGEACFLGLQSCQKAQPGTWGSAS